MSRPRKSCAVFRGISNAGVGLDADANAEYTEAVAEANTDKPAKLQMHRKEQIQIQRHFERASEKSDSV